MTLLGVIKQILLILMEQNKVKNNNIVDMFDHLNINFYY